MVFAFIGFLEYRNIIICYLFCVVYGVLWYYNGFHISVFTTTFYLASVIVHQILWLRFINIKRISFTHFIFMFATIKDKKNILKILRNSKN